MPNVPDNLVQFYDDGLLYGELHQIKDGLNDASKARQLLFEFCDNEELRTHLRELVRT